MTGRLATASCLLLIVAGCSSDAGRNPAGPSAANSTSDVRTAPVANTQTTSVSFSGFDPSTLNVSIDTLTTASVGQPYISEGKIQLQILVDASGNPVPCGTADATYVRLDNVGGGGANPNSTGQTSFPVELDNLDALTGGTVHSVACGASICIRAHYITGGGSTKVDTHTSSDTPYQIVCPTCTQLSMGFWKNHYPQAWPASVISSGMNLGTVHYTAAQLEDIFNTAPAGNGLIILAHQLITAKLNVANGSSSSSIASTIAAADALIGSLVVPPVGGGSLAPSLTGALTQALDAWNTACEVPGS